MATSYVKFENWLRDFLYANARPIFRAFSSVKQYSKFCQQNYYPRIVHSLSRKKFPIPPGQLIHLVGMNENVAWFLESGKLGADSIKQILSKNNIDIEKLEAFLDFGVGCGRILRYWHDLKGPKIYACDYNPLLIAWDKKVLSFAEFTVNPLRGKLAYADNSIDLAYALSVFTHLTVDNQNFWITELTRVVKPGGHLLITTHGDWYLEKLPSEFQEAYKNNQPVVLGADQEGSNICTTFHPKPYVLQTMCSHLKLVDHIPEGALGNPKQDVYLFQKP